MYELVIILDFSPIFGKLETSYYYFQWRDIFAIAEIFDVKVKLEICKDKKLIHVLFCLLWVCKTVYFCLFSVLHYKLRNVC